MQLVRLIVLSVTVLVVVAGYVQEGRRLKRIRELPGNQARDYYEAGRTRSERVMWMMALALAAAALYLIARVSTLPAATTANPTATAAPAPHGNPTTNR